MKMYGLSALGTCFYLTTALFFSGTASADVLFGDNQPGGIEYDLTFEIDQPGQWMSVTTGQQLAKADGSGTGTVGSLMSNGWGSTSADQVTWAKVNLNALQNMNLMDSQGSKARFFKMDAELGSDDGALVPAITAWLGSHDLAGQSDGSGEFFPNKFQEKVPFWFANGLTFGGELGWDVGDDGVAKISGLVPAVNNGLYDLVTLAIGGADWGAFNRAFNLNIRFTPVWGDPIPAPLPAAFYLFSSGLLISVGMAKKQIRNNKYRLGRENYTG